MKIFFHVNKFDHLVTISFRFGNFQSAIHENDEMLFKLLKRIALFDLFHEAG